MSSAASRSRSDGIFLIAGMVAVVAVALALLEVFYG